MSPPTRFRNRTAAGLGLAGVLLVTVAGCGGEPSKTDTAVVLPSDPLATGAAPSAVPTAGTGSATPAATTAPAAAPEPAGAAAEGFGTLKGRVVFNGEAPAPEPIDKSTKDAEVCAKTPATSERLVVDSATKGVKYALVYIPKPTRISPEAKSAASAANVEFDQKNCMFEPHVLATMKGAKITLKSSDPVNHNINAKMRSNSPYNNILTSGQEVPYAPVAAERGPVEVTCDIHPWMRAWWLIIDSPYFAVTDEQGNFEIKDAPAGTQNVVVWQEAAQYVTKPAGDPVAIKADDTTTAPDFKIDPAKVKK